MTKKILFSVLLILIGLNSFSQRGQRIGFVDMNYILENIPAYTRAQNQLDKKVVSWQQDLDKIKNEIAVMQTDLSNEKALLTDDLIADKEEDIVIKQLELKKTEEEYFSSNGSLFLLRKQLVTPIQDQVYNASQEIAKARKYDFVFDKSSDLIMLYSNQANDLSDLVLRSIVKGERITAAKARRETSRKPTVKSVTTPSTSNASNSSVTPSNSEKVSQPTTTSTKEPATTTEPANKDEIPEVSVVDEREAKRAAALAKIEQQKLDRAKKREEQKAAIEKKRAERLKQQQEVREKLKENKESKEDKKEDEKEDDQEENKN